MVINNAVYANVGTAGDDVEVKLEPGFLTYTLENLASEGDMDNTIIGSTPS